MGRQATNIRSMEAGRRKQYEEKSWYEQSRLGPIYVSSEVILYSIDDIVKMSGWSHNTIEKLFSDPRFPSIDFGKRKLIENHALMQYLSVKHEKALDRYWRNDKSKRKK